MRKPLGSCLALPASLDSREIFPGMMLKASSLEVQAKAYA